MLYFYGLDVCIIGYLGWVWGERVYDVIAEFFCMLVAIEVCFSAVND